ncbi:MAG: hypothetical protein ACXW31_00635 [Thermoanaerobaculia bacterium]
MKKKTIIAAALDSDDVVIIPYTTARTALSGRESRESEDRSKR